MEGTVSILSNKGFSEPVTGVIRKSHIDTIYKPTATIKTIFMQQGKGKVDPLDKSGSTYSIKCSKYMLDKLAEQPREGSNKHIVMDHDDPKRSD